jgi:regulator of sigma E protease
MESVVEFLSVAFKLILGLSVLVIVHEFGHFLPAKLFGMKVEKFYLFFDWPRKLFSFHWRGTEYGVGLLPLGGYVKIAGMVDESLDKNLAAQPEPWEFRAKPVWQRFIVMIGGVLMNVVLGITIFTLILHLYGVQKYPIAKIPQGVYVEEGSVAEELGFKTGDKIVSFQGEPVKYLNDVSNPNILLESTPTIVVERDGKLTQIVIPGDYLKKYSEKKDPGALFTPRSLTYVAISTGSAAQKAGLKDGDRIVAVDSVAVQYFDELRTQVKGRKSDTLRIAYEREGKTYATTAVVDESGLLGVRPIDTMFVERQKYGLAEALAPGAQTAFKAVGDNVKGLKKIFSGDADVSKSLQGPVKIAKMYEDTWRTMGWLGVWMLTGLLSMVLALMNLLPIPALDGGHILFLLIEAVTRRKPSDRTLMIAQQAGMVVLLLLMVFVLYNDIFN